MVSSLPVSSTSQLLLKGNSDNTHPLVNKLEPYIAKNSEKLGGGLVLCLGIPEKEIIQEEQKDLEKHGFAFRHHQILQNHSQPLGNGNNM